MQFQYEFAEYLNLIYIIDVSEEQIKKLDGSDLVILAEEVAFLILKREWQKVQERLKINPYKGHKCVAINIVVVA
jgi:hypothetical protein